MINIRDFRDGFLLSWAEKLLTEDENAEWIQIPLENFEKVGGKGIFGNEIDFKDIKGKDEIFSKFWYYALERWQKLKNNTNTNKITDNEMLFNNSKIRFKNNVLHISECFKHNLSRIRDVLTVENRVMTFNEFSARV